MTDEEKAAALERKRRRLEAWKKRQEDKAKAAESAEPKAKISLSLGVKKLPKKKKTKKRPLGFGGFDDNADEDGKEEKKSLDLLDVSVSVSSVKDKDDVPLSSPAKKKRRWDAPSDPAPESVDKPADNDNEDNPKQQIDDDDLDKFMDNLNSEKVVQNALSIDVGGSMLRPPKLTNHNHSHSKNATPVSGGVITPEELAKLTGEKSKTKSTSKADGAYYGPSDWETSASEAETDDEEEEKARRDFLQALKKTEIIQQPELEEPKAPQLAAEVQSEKQQKQKRMQDLKKQAAQAQRASAMASEPDIGRIYYSDMESGVMEEAERTLDVVNAAAGDALEVLAELNKKKELKAVNHSTLEYLPIRKNLYIVPRSVANLTSDQVMERKAKFKIRVRGKGAPAPVESFEECGLSERILSILKKQKIETPFAVQAQCIPCIMAGRDVIGIAKTGSGKTLAYLLPMLRHIADQPPLGPHESGPLGLVLAPARELAVQIHHVAKSFAKQLGLNNQPFP